MKILLTLFVLFFSSSAIAETYACSHELSRWNRAGEVETKTFKRIGEKFVHNRGWEFAIIAESKEELILFEYTTGSFFTTYTIMINKNTLEFTENFMEIEDSKEHEFEALVYGKCVVTFD